MAHARAKLTVLGRQLLVERSRDRRLEAGRRCQSDGRVAPDRLQVAEALSRRRSCRSARSLVSSAVLPARTL